MNAQVQPLVVENDAMLAKTWNGHGVHSEPEEGEEGGDAGDVVPGRDLRFAEIVLTDDQFNALVGAFATRAFFNSSPDRPPERLFTSFSKITLDDKYKNCVVVVTFGVKNDEVKIEAATIKNIRIKFSKAGRPEMSCTVVGPRQRSLAVLDLESFGGKRVHVVISFGPILEEQGEQGQLTLPQPTEGAPVDKTRIIAPGQAEREAETDRQLSEALRGLEKQDAA